MFKSVKSKLYFLAMSASVLICASSVSADQIALTFVEHELTISGEYLGFVENGYLIMTEFGEMHVPAAMVACAGTNCSVVTPKLSTSS